MPQYASDALIPESHIDVYVFDVVLCDEHKWQMWAFNPHIQYACRYFNRTKAQLVRFRKDLLSQGWMVGEVKEVQRP